MSRRDILRFLRAGRPVPGDGAEPLPDPRGPWQHFVDPVARFGHMLEAAGGRVQSAEGRAGIAALASGWIADTGARRVYADPRLPLEPPDRWGAGVAGLDGRSLAATPCAAILDLAVLAGAFGVAENGAVWVDASAWPHPAIHVLPQHLVLLVPAGELVHTFHEAYARLDLSGSGFGCFLAGPSKTADIEQALVVGAHGPRSLTVAWWSSGDAPPSEA